MRSRLGLGLWTLAVVTSSGCYLSHESDAPAVRIDPGPCGPSGPPRCIVSDSPCAPPHAVDALCVVDRWACPRGARVYQRPWLDDMCTPLLDEVDSFVDGVHDAPVPVAIDGECRWLVPFSGPEVTTPNHAPARSGRACDEIELVTTAPIVDVPDRAYCAGPVVYLELWDPFAPDELIVGYSIGTTAEDGDQLRAADPHGYWPKVARLGF